MSRATMKNSAQNEKLPKSRVLKWVNATKKSQNSRTKSFIFFVNKRRGGLRGTNMWSSLHRSGPTRSHRTKITQPVAHLHWLSEITSTFDLLIRRCQTNPAEPRKRHAVQRAELVARSSTRRIPRIRAFRLARASASSSWSRRAAGRPSAAAS